MTTKHQMTREERAFHHRFREQSDSLSRAAHRLLEEASEAASRRCMADSYSYQDVEYEMALENMRLAATEPTDLDCEGLTKLWRYALAAAASMDHYDYETVVGRHVYPADLYSYYRMVSVMVEEVLLRIVGEKRYAENQKENLKSRNRPMTRTSRSSASMEIRMPKSSLGRLANEENAGTELHGSAPKAWGLRKADKPSRRDRGESVTTLSVGDCNDTGKKRGNREEVTQH